MLIDGKRIASELIAELKSKFKPEQFLAAVVVGEDNATASFVKQKENVARELGVDFRVARFPASVAESHVRKEIAALGANEKCGGIILQLPLPANFDRETLISRIPAEKDVDALGGDLVLSPAVGVVQEILKREKKEIEKLCVAVVGIGFLIGQPISKWLEGKCAELYKLDIEDDLGILREADVVMSGAGKAGLIKSDMLKNNALVVDFGYSGGRGDFDQAGVDNISYTPTPGGTGPILVAKLFENFYKLNEK